MNWAWRKKPGELVDLRRGRTQLLAFYPNPSSMSAAAVRASTRKSLWSNNSGTRAMHPLTREFLNHVPLLDTGKVLSSGI